jgi:hypothetical protein
MMSADMNIDHGDSSRSATVVDFNGVGLSPAIVVAPGAAGDKEGEATAGGDTCEAGAGCCVATPEGSCATGRCWATAADTTPTIVNAANNLRIVLNIPALIPGLVVG